jgi:Tfp pilus assembly protein PilN
MHWYLVFQQTGQGLPTTSWLDSLNIAHDDKTDADTLTLQGQSYNSYTVADTLRQLQNQPWFSQVNLQLVSSSPGAAAVGGQLDTINPVHFEIVVQVVAPSQQTQEQNSANNNSAKVQ